jgi:hypothetical protein
MPYSSKLPIDTKILVRDDWYVSWFILNYGNCFVLKQNLKRKWKRRKTWRAVIRSAVTSPRKEFVVLPFFSSMIRPLTLFSEREPLSLKIGLHHNIVRKANSVQKKTNMKNADKERNTQFFITEFSQLCLHLGIQSGCSIFLLIKFMVYIVQLVFK